MQYTVYFSINMTVYVHLWLAKALRKSHFHCQSQIYWIRTCTRLVGEAGWWSVPPPSNFAAWTQPVQDSTGSHLNQRRVRNSCETFKSSLPMISFFRIAPQIINYLERLWCCRWNERGVWTFASNFKCFLLCQASHIWRWSLQFLRWSSRIVLLQHETKTSWQACHCLLWKPRRPPGQMKLYNAKRIAM